MPSQPDETYPVEPLLNDAIAKLNPRDRSAIFLRYAQGKSSRQIAASMGITDAAARKMLERALSRLRAFFASRGATAEEALTALGAATLRPVPNDLLAAATGGAKAAAGAAAVLPISKGAAILMASGKAKLTSMLTAAALLLAFGAIATLVVVKGFSRMRSAAVIPPTAAVVSAVPAPEPVTDPLPPPNFLRGKSGIGYDRKMMAPEWPVILPGSITGTPAIADLEGDGRLAVIIPCMDNGQPLSHPHPQRRRMLFAFHYDGSPVQGWPVLVNQKEAQHSAWACSPSVMDVDGDGRDEVVVVDLEGTLLIKQQQDGPVTTQLANKGDGWGSAPLADIDGDGKPDLVMGWVLTSLAGGPIPGWPRERILHGGYAPCVGDASGDGHMLLYHPFYANTASVGGYDRFGNALPGWPKAVAGQCVYTVMGDVTGDGKMTIFAIDAAHQLFAWRWDGKPLAATRASGSYEGILQDKVDSFNPPALADLDGDGKAEVIVFDSATKSLKAWHGDGSGVSSPDGTIVHIPDARCAGGVSIAGPDDDGTMHLFVATYWVRLAKDHSVTVTNMMRVPSSIRTQCTLADLEGNGTIDAVFGLSDGRAFIYRTGQKMPADRYQWPTANGDFRHTGAWKPRAPGAP